MEEEFSMLKVIILETVTNATEPLSKNIKSIQKHIRDVKETGISMSSEINNTNQMCSRIEEIISLTTGIPDSLDVLKNIGQRMGVPCNETTKSACSKDDVKELQNQLVFKCERGQPMSCLQIFNAGCRKSAEYRLFMETGTEKVYCDQQTDGGGWVVFQRRKDGSVDFFRDWADYKEGFGSLTEEFWLGNEMLHRLLPSSKQYELRVDLGDFEGNSRYAKYSNFSIGPESDGYRLTVGGYSGDTGDSLKQMHNGQTFKTKDRYGGYCTRNWKGGWWYGNCHYANLNGLYNSTIHYQGVIWFSWKGSGYSLRFVEMKFREID